MISSIYNNENTIPVNRLAASMLYKTPEWQEVPKMVKLAVMEIQLPDALINIDFFQKPKPRGANETKIPDRRGFYFTVNRCNKIDTFIVTGYADEKKKWSNIVNGKGAIKPEYWVGDNFDPTKIKKKCKTQNSWWCMNINSGNFERFAGKTVNKFRVSNAKLSMRQRSMFNSSEITFG